MEMQQELEWKKAQAIVINVDLVAAARRHLDFLAAVDRNRCLYEGPALDVAIHRYNAHWLPLLAKHSDSPFFDGPLVVPLDCEWIWHCHRLNPVRYKSDCEELYGSILDNKNVVSTVEGNSKTETEKIWKSLYPDVPYELDFTKADLISASDETSRVVKCTKYDLVSAVKRQSTFFYQMERPHMSKELFLEGAVARYKGFLHLIKRNRERSISSFCVPTYDIDLIWHTHQLHPTSYCEDLVALMNKVLEHDDTDSDRTKGKKLDTGFSGTTKQWEEMYDIRYWRAGSMHKGNAPSPVRTTPYPSMDMMTKKDPGSRENQKFVHIPETKVVEVMLEFVDVKNLPEGHKGGLFASFTKTQPDTIFNAKRSLNIFSESGEKQVACFMCEPSGHLVFELMCNTASSLPKAKPVKTMGSGSVSLEDLLSPSSNLTMEKWLEIVPRSKSVSGQPVYLRVAISVTVPTRAPYILHMNRSRLFSRNSCFFPLPGKTNLLKHGTCIIDDSGNEILSLEMRDSKKTKEKNDGMSRKEVIGAVKSGETNTLAEFTGTEWLLVGSNWSLKFPGTVDKDGHLFELIGDHSVKFFRGRRLEYQPKHCGMQGNDEEFLTGIEFSPEDPYGKAVALLNLKSGTIKVNEEWLLFPGVILEFILSETLKKHGYSSLLPSSKILGEKQPSDEECSRCKAENEGGSNEVMAVKGVACGAACNGSCGSMSETLREVGGSEGIDGMKINSLKAVGAAVCGEGGMKIETLKKVGGGCGGPGACGAACGKKISKEFGIGGGGAAAASGGGGGCGGSGGCGSGCGNMNTNRHSVTAGNCGDAINGMEGGGGCGGSGGCGSGCGSMNINRHSVTAGDNTEGGGCGGGGCNGGCGGGGEGNDSNNA